MTSNSLNMASTCNDKISQPFNSRQNTLSSNNRNLVRLQYFKSAHLEWHPFAESMGWDPYKSKKRFPVKEWIEEKKKHLSKAALERISEAVFSTEGRYHTQVLKTLNELPALCDRLQTLLEHRISDLEHRPAHSQKKQSTSEIHKLIRATKDLIEAKHNALLINRWELQHAKNALKIDDANEAPINQDFTVEIISGPNETIKPLKSVDFVQLIAQWYDKPKSMEASSEEPLDSASGFSGQ